MVANDFQWYPSIPGTKGWKFQPLFVLFGSGLNVNFYSLIHFKQKQTMLPDHVSKKSVRGRFGSTCRLPEELLSEVTFGGLGKSTCGMATKIDSLIFFQEGDLLKREKRIGFFWMT